MAAEVGVVREPPLLRSQLCFNSCRGGVTPPLRVIKLPEFIEGAASRACGLQRKS